MWSYNDWGYKDKKKLYQVVNTFIFVLKLGIVTSKGYRVLTLLKPVSL